VTLLSFRLLIFTIGWLNGTDRKYPQVSGVPEGRGIVRLRSAGTSLRSR
jgi:hypothetical protein